MSKSVKISDTTLRDGEQSPGISFTLEEKVKISRLLDSIGVDEIEAGIPAMCKQEKETIKKILDSNLKARVLGWNRAVLKDIDESLDCGLKAVVISLPVSDIHINYKLKKTKNWIIDNLKRCIDYAKKHKLYVVVGAEDASRTDFEFLLKYIKTIENCGGDRFRFCDTLGILEPLRFYKIIKTIINQTKLEIEIHTHNDFGLATANALAGISAGAKWVDTTVNGLGERSGNAAFEEVIMALKHILGINLEMKTEKLIKLSEVVSKASGREIPVGKPIIGKNCFLHESGIHQDGIIKNPSNYEPFNPLNIGKRSELVIGKHSGRSGIKAFFRLKGIELSDNRAKEILVKVRNKSSLMKRALLDKEIYSFNNT